jgi:hypothetical protein
MAAERKPPSSVIALMLAIATSETVSVTSARIARSRSRAPHRSACRPRSAAAARPARCSRRRVDEAVLRARLGSTSLAELSTLEITGWIKELGTDYAPTTVSSIVKLKSMMLEDAIDERIITAAWTGCRWGELAGLHRTNLHLDTRRLVVDPDTGALHEYSRMRWIGPPKTTASARSISLPPFLITLLRQHLERHDNEFVFTNSRGN